MGIKGQKSQVPRLVFTVVVHKLAHMIIFPLGLSLWYVRPHRKKGKGKGKGAGLCRIPAPKRACTYK